MKIALGLSIVLFLGLNSLSFGQEDQWEEVEAVLLSCKDGASKEERKTCTDQELLKLLKKEWPNLNEQVPAGKYSIQYTIFSTGKYKADRIIPMPQRANNLKGMDLLLEKFDEIIQAQEWKPILPVGEFATGAGNYLIIETSELE